MKFRYGFSIIFARLASEFLLITLAKSAMLLPLLLSVNRIVRPINALYAVHVHVFH